MQNPLTPSTKRHKPAIYVLYSNRVTTHNIHHHTSKLLRLILATTNELLEERLLRLLLLWLLLAVLIDAVLSVDMVHRCACVEADGFEAAGGVLEAV